MTPTLIVFPSPTELKRTRSQLQNWRFEKSSASSSHLTIEKVRSKDLYLCVCGLGKAQAALQTRHAIDLLPDIQHVVCAGAGGALSPQLAIGDVVASTKTIEHDHREGFDPQALPAFPCEPTLSAKASNLDGVYEGIIASGDEDIIDDGRAKELVALTDALAVAWEGAGVARAAKFSGLEFSELRAISDHADSNAPADFKSHLTQAMSQLARVLVHLFGD